MKRMQLGAEVNITSIKKILDSCCHGEETCEVCAGKQCLIGFAKIVSEYAAVKKTLVIPNGIQLVPVQDFKLYETDDVAMALAVINLECKNCMDNHDDNCIVNIIRSSLEVALTGQHIDFAGNPFTYIMSLTRLNAGLGNKVLQYYHSLKDNAS